MPESSRESSLLQNVPMATRPKVDAGHLHVGCSGWAYTSWKPGFYPPKMPAAKFLAYYASQLNSVEVNYTFRMLPKSAMLQSWLASVQESEFIFSFKAPQSITHFKRLRDCAEAVEQFYKSIEPMHSAARMGLVLYQLPPNLKADRELLALFLKDAAQRRRIAFEFRHESWFKDEIFSVLRDHNAALCVAASDDLETPNIQTADFACYRLRESSYSPDRLRTIANQLKTLAATGDAYAYFKHEDEPTGPQRARDVLQWVRGE